MLSRLASAFVYLSLLGAGLLLVLPNASALFGRAYSISGDALIAAELEDDTSTTAPAVRGLSTGSALAGATSAGPAASQPDSGGSSLGQDSPDAVPTANAGVDPAPDSSSTAGPRGELPALTATAAPVLPSLERTALPTEEPRPTPSPSPTPKACLPLEQLLLGPARQLAKAGDEGASATLRLTNLGGAAATDLELRLKLSGDLALLESLELNGVVRRPLSDGLELEIKLERVASGAELRLDLAFVPGARDLAVPQENGTPVSQVELLIQLVAPLCDSRDSRVMAEAVVVFDRPAPKDVAPLPVVSDDPEQPR